MKTVIFYDVTPRSPVQVYRRFWRNVLPPSPRLKNMPSKPVNRAEEWVGYTQDAPSKRRLTSTKLHGDIPEDSSTPQV
jgi:hypothetical protein